MKLRVLWAVGVAAGLVAMAPSRSASAEPSAHEQAIDLFQKGGEAYHNGKFKEAIELLSKAYALEPDPTILYNLARSYEGLSDYEHAVGAYEQYLREVKDIKDRPAIEERVANMKKTMAEKARLEKERDDALKAKAQEGDQPAKNAPPPPRRAPSPIPWIIAAIGVGGVGAGAGLGVVALSKDEDAKTQPDGASIASAHDSAKSFALGSTIAFIAGGVVAGAGLTWGIVDVVTRGPATTETKSEVKVTVGPSSAAVTVHF